MKVLLYDTTDAFLTPGGKTTHAIKLQQEIAKLGVDIQFARWWDGSQCDADIIHFLAPVVNVARLAKKRGIKTFLSLIFDFASSLPEREKKRQILKYRLLSCLPSRVINHIGYWEALPLMDKIQFMHKYDRDTALRFFPAHIKAEKSVIIPHAYDPTDMGISTDDAPTVSEYSGKYLVSIANISERKQTVILAKYAKKAKVPIVFMGSCIETDPYFQSFKSEVDGKYVIYPGYVSREQKDAILRRAVGYVLISKGESGCIAVYEAAAYKIPLLLSNLPWAWGYERATDIFFCDYWNEAMAVGQLQAFYARAKHLDHMPFQARTWADIASLYVNEYKSLLNFNEG